MSRRIPVIPTIVVLAAVATMIALGIWQLQRREWKEGLIARYQQAQTMSSNVPWPQDSAALERALFRASQFDCRRVLAIDSMAGTSAAGQSGWKHVARCEVDGGGEARVALGWSAEPRAPQWRGGPVAGTIGPGGVLYAAKVAPSLGPLAPPDPNDLPNNHLMYAGQWFLFALTALVIYALALRKRWQSER